MHHSSSYRDIFLWNKRDESKQPKMSSYRLSFSMGTGSDDIVGPVCVVASVGVCRRLEPLPFFESTCSWDFALAFIKPCLFSSVRFWNGNKQKKRRTNLSRCFWLLRGRLLRFDLTACHHLFSAVYRFLGILFLHACTSRHEPPLNWPWLVFVWRLEWIS